MSEQLRGNRETESEKEVLELQQPGKVFMTCTSLHKEPQRWGRRGQWRGTA
jgi:hypothetical protein